MGLLSGTRGLVVGIANERSLAYGIAKAARAEGAELAVTYQNELMKKRVEPIAEELRAYHVGPCDLGNDAAIADLASKLSVAGLDFVVHAVASAKREELGGRYVDTSRDGFALALDISVYSLVALTRHMAPLLAASKHHPSILTLSYIGARVVMPNYNVMGVAKAALEASVRYLANDLGPSGVRVNAISAGPARTLSAAGIKGLREMLGFVEREAPLRRNIDAEEIGRAALAPLSAIGSGMTGEVIHIDAGYHILGGGAWA
ncbi:MAG: enoyl-ACP reductase [Clostridia bacterium]|nr:enoyl-ACP reductase [Deltaproteobacteria bacterium]